MSPEPMPSDPFEPWRIHLAEVSRCRGTACFAALAAHFGTTSPVVLEARVDQRHAYLTANGDRAWSGIYRRWQRDGVLPTDKTAERVLIRSGGAVDLRRWRDLALWWLLTPGPKFVTSLQQRAAQFSSQIRRLVFENYESSLVGEYSSLEIAPRRIVSLRNLRSLEAFHALVYLARESEWIGSEPRQMLPAYCALEIFPGVLRRYAPLRYRGELLSNCVESVLSRRLLPTGHIGAIQTR